MSWPENLTTRSLLSDVTAGPGPRDLMGVRVLPDGHRAAFVVMDPEQFPVTVREAVEARNIAMVIGYCPACDETEAVNPRERSSWKDEHGLGHTVFEHESWCPAADDNLIASLRWLKSEGRFP